MSAPSEPGGAGGSLPPSLAANPLLRNWLAFEPDGMVTIRSGKVEYGQGVWTALAQVAAEELDVELSRVTVAPVSTAASPDEGVTSGSRSIQESGGALRQACAQARRILLAAAAARLGCDPAALSVTDGSICAAAGQTGLTYWSVAAPGMLDQAAGAPVAAKAPARWKVAGRSAPRIDLPDKVTAQPRFLSDLVLPEMLFGRVIRPPAAAATLDALDELDVTELHPGVVAVVRDGSFLGVIAATDRAAVAAAAAQGARASWTVRESLPDENDLRGFLLSEPAQVQAVVTERDNSVTATGSRAGASPENTGPRNTGPGSTGPGSTGPGRAILRPPARTMAAEYSRPFLAHASMGPSCAIARWDGGTLTVWTHSQGIFSLRGALAAGLGLDPGQVRVHHVEGAGAYGHNAADDAALDAALLARQVPGRPVRVLWSREDEMSWGPMGPAMLARLSADLDGAGRIQTWRQDVWSNGFIGRPGTGGQPRLLALSHLAGGQPMEAALDGPATGAMGATRNAVPGYDIPDLAVTRHRLLTMPIRTSSLRSLGAFLNVFAIESFMDELAAAAGADPVAFRLAHLTDPRARRVIETVAAFAGWPAQGGGDATGLGIGYARYKGTAGYCAAVAQVEAVSDVRVRKVWLAVDVGRVINPDGVINQVEGGTVQSASWATRERVRFDRSRITSVNWDSYPVLRFSEVPAVAVRLVDAPDEPETGAGELAQGPVAGAIGNALAAAVGVRVRDLPITREQVMRAISDS